MAIWPARRDAAFARRLNKAGFALDEVEVRARPNNKGPRHTIWFAREGGVGGHSHVRFRPIADIDRTCQFRCEATYLLDHGGNLREIFSGIWQTASTLLGVLVFAALIGWAAKAHSRLWRAVAADYPKRSNSPSVAAKTLDTIVIARRGTSGPLQIGNADYRQYAGALVSVHDGSLFVSLAPPFNFFCAPIELPFDEMELRPTFWALWPEPFAVRMRRLPGLDVVLARDTVQWIRAHTDKAPFGLEA